MAQRGFESDIEQEKFFREAASVPMFKNTIMVFRKKQNENKTPDL